MEQGEVDQGLENLKQKLTAKTANLEKGLLFKAVLLLTGGTGLVLGSVLVMQVVYRQPAPETADSMDGINLESYFSKSKQPTDGRQALSSEEVRSKDFEREFEGGASRKESLSFIKQPEEERKSERAKERKSEEAEQAEAQPAPMRQVTKPKPQLKGFNSKPEVGSISGFQMKTKFGGLKKKGSMGSDGGAPNTGIDPAAMMKGMMGGAGQLGAGKPDDLLKGMKSMAGGMGADTCVQVCAKKNKIARVTKQADCRGKGQEWIEGACVESEKMEKCEETDPMCK